MKNQGAMGFLAGVFVAGMAVLMLYGFTDPPLRLDDSNSNHTSVVGPEKLDKEVSGASGLVENRDREPVLVRPRVLAEELLPSADPLAPKVELDPAPQKPIVWHIGRDTDGLTSRKALALEVWRWLDGRLSLVAVESYISNDAAEAYVRSALQSIKNSRDRAESAELWLRDSALEDKKAKGAVEVFQGKVVLAKDGKKYIQWPKGCEDVVVPGERVTSWRQGSELRIVRIRPGEYPKLDKAWALVKKETEEFKDRVFGLLQDAPFQ